MLKFNMDFKHGMAIVFKRIIKGRFVTIQSHTNGQ